MASRFAGMDSDASQGDAGEARGFSLGNPTGGGIGKKTVATRRTSKRLREDSEADEIQVGRPVAFTSKGKISNNELLRSIVEAFTRAQGEQDTKHSATLQDLQEKHIEQVREITHALNKKHQEGIEKIIREHQETAEKQQQKHQQINEKQQNEHQKITEKHQNEHQKLTKQIQELQRHLKDSKITEISETVRRVEEQLAQLSIAGSSGPSAVTSPATTNPRPTWSQVASNQDPSPQRSARTELLSDSNTSGTLAKPAANEGRALEIDISRARGEKKDLAKVKDKWIKAIKENQGTEDVEVEYIREVYTNKVELCLTSIEQAQRTRDNPRWIEKAMPGARIRGETWHPIKVDGLSKATILDPEGNGRTIRSEIVTNFAQDNSKDNVDCTAMKAVWISRPSDKVNGSMVIWLKRREAALYLLQKVTVIFGPTAGFAAPYQAKENNDPCFNCNSYGHYQFKCTKPAKCGHCSQNHQSRDCMNKDNPKCPACNGAHSVMDRRCVANPRNDRNRPQNQATHEGTSISPT